MGNERNRAGTSDGFIKDFLRVSWPIAGVGILALLSATWADGKGIDRATDLIPKSYGDNNKLVATPVFPEQEIAAPLLEPQSEQQLQDHCDRGGELRGQKVRVVDEDGNIIEGEVQGASNHFSIRDRKGESKLLTVFCDEIVGDIISLE